MTEPTEESAKIKRACRKLLNTAAGSKLEPLYFVDDLSKAKIVDDADANLLRTEKSLPLRQYYLFLQILPSKDAENLRVAAEIFRKGSGHQQNDQQSGSRVLADAISQVFIGGGGGGFVVEDGEIAEALIEEPCVRQSVTAVQVSDSGAGSEIFTASDGSVEGKYSIGEEFRVSEHEVQVQRTIGRGGFAIVHYGFYAGREVAVKKFHNYDEFALKIFKSEIDVMKKLDHPNTVAFVGYVRINDDRQLWLLTEFIEGGSMRRFCGGGGDNNKSSSSSSLEMSQKLEIMAKCWTGLAYLHAKNCCHKDLSPDNVLISEDLKLVKISDFGLAEFKVLMVTATTKATGTTMYQPPEFAFESGSVRHPVKSDVYSLGASLCELFAHQWFWNLMDGDGGARRPRNQWQVMCKLLEQRKNLDSGLAPDPEPDCWSAVPDSVKPILAEAVNPDYARRKSADEMKRMTEALIRSS